MNIQPTKEQKAIISAVQSEQNLLISAFAGSGKTATLCMIAHAYPKKVGLYLAYNKVIKNDAARKFPNHIDCLTVHGLAYRVIGVRYKEKLLKPLNPDSIVNYFSVQALRHKVGDRLFSASETNIAACAKSIVFAYCNTCDAHISAKHMPGAYINIIKNQNNTENFSYDIKNLNTPQSFLEHYAHRCLTVARKLWREMVNLSNLKIGMSHDGYLKLYQLSKPIIAGYDYILLDEAQDANPPILDILSNQTVQCIYVGDKYQQIYAWRGSVNAMDQVAATKLHLTKSFRFGESVANLANNMLRSLNEPTKIQGNEQIDSQLKAVDASQQYTLLCRTNTGVIENCLAVGRLGLKVCCIGGMNVGAADIISAYHLWLGDLTQVRTAMMKPYATWSQFEAACQMTGDADLKATFQFVDNYKAQTPSALETVTAFSGVKESDADVIISTIHRAKGREWSQVRVGSDVAPFSACRKDERFLWYVLVTRAVDILDMSEHTLLPEKDSATRINPTRIDMPKSTRKIRGLKQETVHHGPQKGLNLMRQRLKKLMQRIIKTCASVVNQSANW